MSNNVESDNYSDEIKDLLKRNVELTEEIHESITYIKKYIFWQKVFGFLKVFIFLIPIIIGLIYLPPILEQVLEQYKTILDIGSTVNNVPNIESLTPGLLDMIR
ncbi:hypothetical protein C0584_05450 [Candidatus Parcubacteria bacterium]|nr:MAG: hypothetical protein C0584_05450 [Candidatus Parcubacteria bacterium]